MTSKNTALKNDLKKIVAKHSEIDNILLFGSVVRGKKEPGDTDVLVVFKERVDKKAEYLIRQELEKQYSNVSTVSKTRKTILDPAFDARESILFEGISLISGKNLAAFYGFDSLGMFKYAFKNWSKLKKTKFYYALNGRGEPQGMLQKLDGMKLSDGIILVPLERIEPTKTFLESWGLEYAYIPMLIPQRMNKKRILES